MTGATVENNGTSGDASNPNETDPSNTDHFTVDELFADSVPVQSVWYCWTAPSDLNGGFVTFDNHDNSAPWVADGGSGDVPPIITVLTGTHWDTTGTGSGLQPVQPTVGTGFYSGYDVPGGYNYSNYHFPVVGGQKYIIEVTDPGNYFGYTGPTSGSFDLRWFPDLDPDNDGVLNPNDNCPTVYNPGQENTYHGDHPDLGDACSTPPAPPAPTENYPLVYNAYGGGQEGTDVINHEPLAQSPFDTYTGYSTNPPWTGQDGTGTFPYSDTPYAAPVVAETNPFGAGPTSYYASNPGDGRSEQLSPNGSKLLYYTGSASDLTHIVLIDTEKTWNQQTPLDVSANNPGLGVGWDSGAIWLNDHTIVFVHHRGCPGTSCSGHPVSDGDFLSSIVSYDLTGGTYTTLADFTTSPVRDVAGEVANGNPRQLTYSAVLDKIAFIRDVPACCAVTPTGSASALYMMDASGGTSTFIDGYNGTDDLSTTWAYQADAPSFAHTLFTPTTTGIVYHKATVGLTSTAGSNHGGIFTATIASGGGVTIANSGLVANDGSLNYSGNTIQYSPDDVHITYCVGSTLYVGSDPINSSVNNSCAYAWNSDGLRLAFLTAPSLLQINGVLNVALPLDYPSVQDTALGSEAWSPSGLQWGPQVAAP